MKRFARWISLALALCLLASCAAFAEETNEREKVSFLLLCNEGMRNDGDNVGNTLMLVTFDPETGYTRLLMFTWDTFINMEGYDIPQLIDQPYRVDGPEATVKAFNENFNQNIDLFLSVNYLNLATLIDTFGGVNVDITRAERNALNGMVASKKENVQAMADMDLLDQMLVEGLAQAYYLDEWGEDTHLNGMQAVAFGWLQYDSVYNCCLREGQVISDLFNSVGETINKEMLFYTNDTDVPSFAEGRRVINLDDPTEEDVEFLYEMVKPIFDKTYNNLTKEDIINISFTLGRAAYLASRQGVDVFKDVMTDILPLEAQNPYDTIAGQQGHIIDFEANAAAITEFLYGE